MKKSRDNFCLDCHLVWHGQKEKCNKHPNVKDLDHLTGIQGSGYFLRSKRVEIIRKKLYSQPDMERPNVRVGT